MPNDSKTMKDGSFCTVIGTQQLLEDLAGYAQKSDRARKDVKKIGLVLERLSHFGLHDVSNKEQFRKEDTLASNNAGGTAAVYAVKSFQLRVYGGFISKGVFACVEMAVKKKDKADREQLKRVARILGEMK